MNFDWKIYIEKTSHRERYIKMDYITIRRPDDWHLHLRDSDILQAVLPYTAELFGRAIVMPNIKPPARTKAEIAAYRQRITRCLPQGHRFQPLMTLYLTDETSPEEISICTSEQLISAVKLYPVGATTNSEHGVTDIRKVYPVIERMQELDIPLSVHGESSAADVDLFDREAVFIERDLQPLRKDFPELKVVFEHLTSKIGVDYVRSCGQEVGATITPHHLLITRNDIFTGGLQPYMYCLPIAKREEDRLAIRQAAVSGDSRFFFGSDSAPHFKSSKETSGGAAGIFNVPTAIPYVTQVFEEEAALDRLEDFLSINGARFYNLPINTDTITLQKLPESIQDAEDLHVGMEVVKIFRPRSPLNWTVTQGLQKT
jgi:dihydroorotase